MKRFFMKVDLFIFLLFLSRVTFPSVVIASQQSNVLSLCEKGETIYFSCVLENEKIVSLCGDGDNLTSPDIGYM